MAYETGEQARAAINKVPGSGPIRGVHIFNGDVIAFRDNTTGDACEMWKSVPSGYAPNASDLLNTWTETPTSSGHNWNAVCYGNGLFVAVGDNGSDTRISTSPDGVTWTPRTAPRANDWRAVCFGDGLFVAVSSTGTGDRVMTSPDGITWTIRSSAADSNWRGVAWGNGVFVAVAESGTYRVMTSPDGITWTARTAAASLYWRGVSYGIGKFVATSAGPGASVNNVMYSTDDGATWTLGTTTSQVWSDVAFGSDRFAIINAAGGVSATSTDGISWTEASTGFVGLSYYTLTYGGGLFVAVEQGFTWASGDGLNWSVRASPSTNLWYSMAYGAGAFVAVGATDGIMSSTVESWQAVDMGRTLTLTPTASIFPTTGMILVGASSGAHAIVRRGFDAGSTYTVTVTDQVGTFQSESIDILGTTGAFSIAGDSTPNRLSPGGQYRFINANFTGALGNIKTYGVNGIDKCFEFDGTSFLFVPTGMVYDRPSHIAFHNNYLYLAFPGGSLQNSAIGDPYTWTPVTGASEIAIGQEITGLLSTTQVLVVFAKNSVQALYGSSASDWELKIVSRDSGAYANSIQVMYEPVFLDDVGLRALSSVQQYGDFQAGALTLQVSPLLRQKRQQGIYPTASVRVRANDIYRVFFSDGSGLAIYLDGKRAQAMPIDYGMVVRCAASDVDIFGVDMSVFGSDDGFIYRMDAGNSFDGGDVSAHFQLAYNHVKSPNVQKRWQQADLEIDCGPNTPLVLDAYFNFGDPKTPQLTDLDSTAAEVDGTEPAEWNVVSPASCRNRISGGGTNASLRVSSNLRYDEPPVIHGVTLGYSDRKAIR